MKITLRAAGIIKTGPERELTDFYLARAARLAPSLGFAPPEEIQVDLRKAKTRTDQSIAVLSAQMPGAISIVFDERGKNLTSSQMARRFAQFRDAGTRALVLHIGPAEGFDPKTIPAGTERWALGTQTWPHKLLRVMATEQIYRAFSILGGRAYHKE